MKRAKIRGVAAMLLVLGATTSASAQRNEPGESKDRPEQAQSRQAKAAPQKPQRALQTWQHVRRPEQQPQRSPQEAQAWLQQKGWAQNGSSHGHATFQQNRSQNWSSEHRSWPQRGGYGGYYIPEGRLNVSFGSQHNFRVGAMPTMYMGYPRFAYGGFSFLMVDPWPGDWSSNWYSRNDVYVDYDYNDGGYYLYNRSYPQERLAIAIVL